MVLVGLKTGTMTLLVTKGIATRSKDATRNKRVKHSESMDQIL